jgi:hypothetical protein
MDLNEALGQFDKIEANLHRLDKVWEEMVDLIYGDGPIVGVRDERRYDTLLRSFGVLAKSLPAIGSYQFDGYPTDANEVAHLQWRARDIGDPSAYGHTNAIIYAPNEGLDDYRFRFLTARRDLVRERIRQLIEEIDELLVRLQEWVPDDNECVLDPDWSRLTEAFSEVERLAGNHMPKTGRWDDLKRHISFGEGHDVHDIANRDWPTIKPGLEAGLYSELEPLPVEVDDLAVLVSSKPKGRVSTKLEWDAVNDEDFERLLFNIVSDAEGYENPKLLTRTNAPDRGRDISVDRGLPDSLSGGHSSAHHHSGETLALEVNSARRSDASRLLSEAMGTTAR